MGYELLDELKKESESQSQWKPHPLGDYEGVVEDIKVKDVNGTPVYEIYVRTDKGRTRKTIWREAMEKTLERVNGDQHEARARWKKQLGIMYSMVSKLGIDPGDANNDQELEDALYNSLGYMKGKEVQVRVTINKKDANNPFAAIYPPRGTPRNVGHATTAAENSLPSHGAADPQVEFDMDSLPF